jgi:hypothetical protein
MDPGTWLVYFAASVGGCSWPLAWRRHCVDEAPPAWVMLAVAPATAPAMSRFMAPLRGVDGGKAGAAVTSRNRAAPLKLQRSGADV